MQQIEKWGVFEIALNGKRDGNPFLDYEVAGSFRSEQESVRTRGFYDGGGVYRVRFMPSFEGRYRYTIEGSAVDAPVEGEFEAVPAAGNNHGPVRVVDETLLAYADGTPHYSVGTTCYAWVNQDMALQERTLDTLSRSPFNKIRFCIFPKFYEFNRKEPIPVPLSGETARGWTLRWWKFRPTAAIGPWSRCRRWITISTIPGPTSPTSSALTCG